MKNSRCTLRAQAPGSGASKLIKLVYLALLFHTDDYTNIIMAAVRLNRPVGAGLFTRVACVGLL